MYTIKVTLTDDDTAEDTSTTMVVVYDPDAGPASGNGWARTTSGEEAGFTFHASYPPGSRVPDGAETFSFRSGGLNLRSHQGLEWLVITPEGKIAMKGVGEVEPGRRARAVIYGYRGCHSGVPAGCQPGGHRHRIVMWPESAGITPADEILYDNSPNGHYDVDKADPHNVVRGTVTILM